jgi:hypothetical protein
MASRKIGLVALALSLAGSYRRQQGVIDDEDRGAETSAKRKRTIHCPPTRTFLDLASVRVAGAAFYVREIIHVCDLALRHGTWGAGLEAGCKAGVLAVLELANTSLEVGNLQRTWISECGDRSK